MFRPTGFADLAGKRVGIFGYGLEGRTAHARIASLASEIVVVDDEPVAPEVLLTSEGGLDALLQCDVVLKSPGIPRRRPDVLNLDLHGVCVTSALNLWLGESDLSRVVAITGTKGKSTTTALVTFFLHCLNEPAHRLGNIGQPPYDPDLDLSSGWMILEVSSFQCTDLEVAPKVVVVTSLGADHIDWHGSLEQYHDDKLSLTRHTTEHVTIIPDVPTFQQLDNQLGGELLFTAPDESGLASELGLLGAHSNYNVALALSAVSQLTSTEVDVVRSTVRSRASEFVPLRGRLSLVRTVDLGSRVLRFVDDGLATSALPASAALEVFRDSEVSLIVGGFDRGVEYSALVDALLARQLPTHVVATGPAGVRIASLLTPTQQLSVNVVGDLETAVAEATSALSNSGVVLFSPAAPSFDAYKNWEERSEHFDTLVSQLSF